MKRAMIDIIPGYASAPEDFKARVRAAHQRQETGFPYGWTTFQLLYKDDGSIERLWSRVKGLAAPLPPAFQSGRVPVELVRLSCITMPRRLVAREGVYMGSNFGYPDIICIVDPKGKHNYGKPYLSSEGKDFTAVVEFFKFVMLGNLSPGHGENPWSTKVVVRP